jgi:hypothetical protein
MTPVIKLPRVHTDDGEAMKAHPAAEMFPLIDGIEFDALVADIAANGQREAIVILDGQILDGRNRYRACRQLGMKPRLVPWDQQGTPERFVASMNLHRRHLNEGQRAMIAARIATNKPGDNTRKQDAEIKADLLRSPPTQPEAAALLKVGRTSIIQAKKVLAEGTPEQIAAVDGGASVHVMANKIRARKSSSTPRGKSKGKVSLAQTGNNPERIQRMKVKADVWAKISGALDALTALPLPSDVAEIVASHPRRRAVTVEKLARSVQWLADFERSFNQCLQERSNADASDRD